MEMSCIVDETKVNSGLYKWARADFSLTREGIRRSLDRSRRPAKRHRCGAVGTNYGVSCRVGQDLAKLTR
jgi:hypothetical protein